jgi:hypothetical protein
MAEQRCCRKSAAAKASMPYGAAVAQQYQRSGLGGIALWHGVSGWRQ